MVGLVCFKRQISATAALLFFRSAVREELETELLAKYCPTAELVELALHLLVNRQITYSFHCDCRSYLSRACKRGEKQEPHSLHTCKDSGMAPTVLMKMIIDVVIAALVTTSVSPSLAVSPSPQAP